jgi:hypothetical protein
MMRQSLQQVRPERGRAGLGPAAIGGIAPLKAEVAIIGARTAPSYGGQAMGVIGWRQRVPRASFQQRRADWRQRLVGLRQFLAGWRARNWRRAVLAWFGLSLIILAVAAEPRTDFPEAQARLVPAVRMVMHVAGALTAAGIPVLLVALP